MKRIPSVVLYSSLICVLLPGVSAASKTKPASPGSNWAQWRGPDSQGISNETNLPTEWSETKNVLWKTAIPGLGFS
ncbi:MAG: hypothetical protein WAV20_09670, partial [Blastocatellia bacterium]